MHIGYHAQAIELPTLKASIPEYNSVHSQVLQNILKQVDNSFSNFFRRIKERKCGKRIRPGFPKFKSRNRFRSITYPQSGFKIIDNTHLEISKIGTLRIFMHRPIPGNATIKTMSIKHDRVGDWFVTFTVEFPEPEAIKNPTTKIGVDVGLKKLAVTSSGEMTENMRFLNKGLDNIKRLQRIVSRKKKGSNRRRKAVRRLAKAHRKVERQRDDYLHNVSKWLVDNHDMIVFEDLKINNMVKDSRLSRAIMDAAWGKLRQYTTYKAENAGKLVAGTDPAGTSKTCHICGEQQQISLSDRIFVCSNCGQSTDRDWNAALNIDKSVGPDWTELFNKARRVGISAFVVPTQVNASYEAGSPHL